MAQYFHLTVRTCFGFQAFKDRREAGVAWKRLRDAFPDIAAACLMPTHLHVLAWGETAHELRLKLVRVLTGLQKTFPRMAHHWEGVPEPQAIPDRKHLLRQIRYVHLNPCRDSLAGDPLEWEWSTHRDYVGGVKRPWPDVEKVRKELKWATAGFAERLHAYVSADPSVRVEGTLPPARPGSIDVLSIAALDRAVVVAERNQETTTLGRRLLRDVAIVLAAEKYRCGTGVIAKYFGMTPRRVQQIRKKGQRTDPRLIQAVELVLTDVRLRPVDRLCGISLNAKSGRTYWE